MKSADFCLEYDGSSSYGGVSSDVSVGMADDLQ